MPSRVSRPTKIRAMEKSLLTTILSSEDDDEEEEINNRIIKKIEDYYPENKFTVRYMF